MGPLDLNDSKTELISFNVAMINFYPQEPFYFNKRIPVIFGQIKDIEIKDVIVGKKDGTSENVETLENPEGKFYFKIGRYNIVKALNMNDEILYSSLIEYGDEILDFP